MTPETAQVVVAVVSCCGVVVTAWLANGARTAARGADRKAERAGRHAEEAADNTHPVSNGFTGEVRQSLSDILVMATEARDAATRAEGKVDRHLEAHANGHVRAVS